MFCLFSRYVNSLPTNYRNKLSLKYLKVLLGVHFLVTFGQTVWIQVWYGCRWKQPTLNEYVDIPLFTTIHTKRIQSAHIVKCWAQILPWKQRILAVYRIFNVSIFNHETKIRGLFMIFYACLLGKLQVSSIAVCVGKCISLLDNAKQQLNIADWILHAREETEQL